MNYAERIRDLTDKFMQEMENLKTKNTVVTGEKEKEASKHAEQVHDLIEKQNKELQDLGNLSCLYSKEILFVENLVSFFFRNL